MRAATPLRDGHVARDGVRVFFEVYGAGEPTVFLLMPDTIVSSRAWKAQVPFLARTSRVVLIDPRGNGRSDTQSDPAAWADRELMDDAWGVLEEVGADRAVLVGVCSGAGHALWMAAERPDRVLGVCAINPGLPLTPPHPWKVRHDFDADFDAGLGDDDGWARLNRHSWGRDWAGFSEFFFAQLFPEPHSTKQREDGVAWASGTTVDAMLCEHDAPGVEVDFRALLAQVRCPVLVITGSEDRCQPPERGRIAAELTGGDLVVIEGAGHLPQARDPVKVNLLLRDFLAQVRRS